MAVSTVHRSIEGRQLVVVVDLREVIVGGECHVLLDLNLLRHVVISDGLSGGESLLASLDGSDMSTAVVYLTQTGGRSRGAMSLTGGRHGLLGGGGTDLASGGRERGADAMGRILDLLGVERCEHVDVGEVVGRSKGTAVVGLVLGRPDGGIALGTDLLFGDLLEKVCFGTGILLLLVVVIAVVVVVVKVQLLGLDDGLCSLICVGGWGAIIGSSGELSRGSISISRVASSRDFIGCFGVQATVDITTFLIGLLGSLDR